MKCRQCNAPAIVFDRLNDNWCERCWRVAMWTLAPSCGLGEVVGPAAGYPDRFFDLRCTNCGATWVGADLAVCAFCIDREAAKLMRRPAEPVPAGICALICPQCEWRWDGLTAEACRRPGGQCHGRGSHHLALDFLRRLGKIA